MRTLNTIAAGVLVAGALASTTASADTLVANAGVANNYIWRGLTQTENEAAVSGGLDYTHDSGFYAGTWISNVNFGPSDGFSYENDIYFGFSKAAGDVTFNIGYMYYNYDAAVETDFGEVYGSIAFKGFTLKAASLVHTEADEPVGADFGFAEQLYINADYVFKAPKDIDIGVHVGWHDGEFMEWFNLADKDYMDYSVWIAKSGFKLMISDTNVKGDAAGAKFDNAKPKFVISYTIPIEMF